MNKRNPILRYRAVDLSLWAVLLLVFENVIILASTRWFPGEPYTVSLTPLITAIVLVRWGPWAAIHAVLGALILCVRSGAAPLQYAIYGIGNCLSLAVLPCLPLFGGREGIAGRSGRAIAFGMAVLALMQAGRAAVALLCGSAPALAAGFFTTEVITDLFTLVILWIVRRQNGMLEDQRRYFARVQEEARRHATENP